MSDRDIGFLDHNASLATKERWPLTLRGLLRQGPLPAPEDSVERTLHLMRTYGVEALPVTLDGHLMGLVGRETLLRYVKERGLDDEVKWASVGDFIEPAEETVAPETPLDTLRKRWHSRLDQALPALPVVDQTGYCLGYIHPLDLFFPEPMLRPQLPPIGGMATLFGVYLTDGRIQAGASNLALVATGAFMGLLILGSLWLSSWGLERLALVIPFIPRWVFNMNAALQEAHPWWSACAVCVRSVVIFPYLLLMRFSVLAGYHAAEHQTVHAIERQEPLVVAVVRRMPRVHPRCGTNLVAAMGIFAFVAELASCFPWLQDAAIVLAGVVTLFTWRRVGAFLQAWFTTRPASVHQLEKGIQAGQELIERYLQSYPMRPHILRKIWCMGLLQALIGMGIVALIISYVPFLSAFLR
jgi:CBS domain-containing protein